MLHEINKNIFSSHGGRQKHDKKNRGKRENKYDKDRRRVGMKKRKKSEYTDETDESVLKHVGTIRDKRYIICTKR